MMYASIEQFYSVLNEACGRSNNRENWNVLEIVADRTETNIKCTYTLAILLHIYSSLITAVCKNNGSSRVFWSY
jgi:hypothetical protein